MEIKINENTTFEVLLYLKMFNNIYQVVAEIQASDIWHQSLTIQQGMTKSQYIFQLLQ